MIYLSPVSVLCVWDRVIQYKFECKLYTII